MCADGAEWAGLRYKFHSHKPSTPPTGSSLASTPSKATTRLLLRAEAMSSKGLFGFWFCMLALCFLVPPCFPQVLDPAHCLVSGIYNLIRLPERKDGLSCWQDCFKEPKCHMAVVTRPLSGSERCLLVNCLNQGQHSQPRDPSEQIKIYPKSTLDDERRQHLMTGLGYGLAEETLRCHDDVNMASYSSCRSGAPRFFYNRTSYRCERFLSGCGSNRNTFITQEGCEALCKEKYLCYRPVERGQRPPFHFGDSPPKENFFFYNVSSWRCDRFYFRGSASNGNIFRTVEACQNLCGDVKASAGSVPTKNTAVLSAVSLLFFLMLLLAGVFVGGVAVKFFRAQRSSAIRFRAVSSPCRDWCALCCFWLRPLQWTTPLIGAVPSRPANPSHPIRPGGFKVPALLHSRRLSASGSSPLGQFKH